MSMTSATEIEKSSRDTSVSSSSAASCVPSVPIATTAQERPKIEMKITETSAKIDVTPAWFDPVSLPKPNQIRFPPDYDKTSATDFRKVNCLATYRSMTKEKSLDFINHPFQGTVDDTETLVVVLDQLIDQLGIGLSFSKSQFNYNDSDYRTACGIGDLGSIHSIITSGDNIKTAKFQFHFDLNYHDIASNLKDFILRFINAIANVIKCDPQFIRVFAIENVTPKNNNISVNFGITTRSETETNSLAKQLQDKVSTQSIREQEAADVLRHIIPDRYEYTLEPVLVHLQLQKSDFEPKYNIDYKEGHPLEDRRGGRPYYLPISWYRHALKVEDKYPQDKLWLGMKNTAGEWSVAYHGTHNSAAKGITQDGLLYSKSKKDAYKRGAIQIVGSKADVKGIYLATHCEGGAAKYAPSFPVKNDNGKMTKYKMVFQCRVEPGKYTEHVGPAVDVGKALRVFDEKAIRPYGILLKEEKVASDDGILS